MDKIFIPGIDNPLFDYLNQRIKQMLIVFPSSQSVRKAQKEVTEMATTCLVLIFLNVTCKNAEVIFLDLKMHPTKNAF